MRRSAVSEGAREAGDLVGEVLGEALDDGRGGPRDRCGRGHGGQLARRRVGITCHTFCHTSAIRVAIRFSPAAPKPPALPRHAPFRVDPRDPRIRRFHMAKRRRPFPASEGGENAERPFATIFGAEVVERTEIAGFRIAEVYRLWGFDPLESSAVEDRRGAGQVPARLDRPNPLPHARVFACRRIQEPSGRPNWARAALRSGRTAPRGSYCPAPERVARPPYRALCHGAGVTQGSPGRGRVPGMFYQCDADTVGTGSVAADAEICMMLAMRWRRWDRGAGIT